MVGFPGSVSHLIWNAASRYGGSLALNAARRAGSRVAARAASSSRGSSASQPVGRPLWHVGKPPKHQVNGLARTVRMSSTRADDDLSLPSREKQLRDNCGGQTIKFTSVSNAKTPEDRLTVVFDAFMGIAERSNRGFVNSDGSSLLFLGDAIRHHLREKFPDLSSRFEEGDFSICQGYMKSDKGTNLTCEMFEDLGIPVQKQFETPLDYGSLIEGQLSYNYPYVSFVITRPDKLSDSLTPANRDLLRTLGIDPSKPLSKYDFFRLNRLAFSRLVTQSKYLEDAEILANVPGFVCPSLCFEEHTRHIWPMFNDPSFLKHLVRDFTVLGQTRAANRQKTGKEGTEIPFGSHRALHTDTLFVNGDDSSRGWEELLFDHAFNEEVLGTGNPDYSDVADTGKRRSLNDKQVMLGIPPYEQLVRSTEVCSPTTLKPEAAFLLWNGRYGGNEQGLHYQQRFLVTEEGDEAVVVTQDGNGARPIQFSTSGKGPSRDLYAASQLGKRYSDFYHEDVYTPKPGVPFISTSRGVTVWRDPEFLADAQEIYDGIPSASTDYEFDKDGLPDEFFQRVKHAFPNALEADKQEYWDAITSSGKEPPKAMGLKGAHGDIVTVDFNRGTLPVINPERMQNPLDLQQIIGSSADVSRRSIIDIDWSDAVKIPSPLVPSLAPFSYLVRGGYHEAVMPADCGPSEMVRGFEDFARHCVERAKAGDEYIGVTDTAMGDPMGHVPLEHNLVLARGQAALHQAMLRGQIPFKPYKFVADIAQTWDVSTVQGVFTCGAAYVFFRSMYSGQIFQTREEVDNWHEDAEHKVRQLASQVGCRRFSDSVGLRRIAPVKLTGETIRLARLDKTYADQYALTVPGLAKRMKLFYLNDTSVPTGEFTSKGSEKFTGRAPFSAETSALTQTGRGDKALELQNRRVRTSIHRVKMDRWQKPRQYAVVGLGPSGIQVGHELSQHDPEATVVYFEKSKVLGGNGIAGLHRFHGARMLGSAAQLKQTFTPNEQSSDHSLHNHVFQTRVSESYRQKLSSIFDHVFDTTGLIERPPNHPLATPLSTFYNSYNLGAAAPKPSIGRPINPGLKGVSGNVAEGGGDAVIDAVITMGMLTRRQIEGTGFFGSRYRTPGGVTWVYRGAPWNAPHKMEDLREAVDENSDVVIQTVFDRATIPADLTPAQKEKLDFWNQYWVGNTVTDLKRAHQPFGHSVTYLPMASVETIKEDEWGLLTPTIRFDDGTTHQIGGIGNVFQSFGFLPAISQNGSLEEQLQARITRAGQAGGVAGDLPHVTRATTESVVPVIEAIKEKGSDFKRQSGVTNTLRTMFPDASILTPSQVVNFSSWMMGIKSKTVSPLTSPDAINQTYAKQANDNQQTVNPEAVRTDIALELDELGVEGRKGHLTFYDFENRKTTVISLEQVERDGNALNSLEREYREERLVLPVVAACNGERTCTTCECIPSVQGPRTESDHLISGPLSQIASMTCAIEPDNFSAFDGSVLVIGHPSMAYV